MRHGGAGVSPIPVLANKKKKPQVVDPKANVSFVHLALT